AVIATISKNNPIDSAKYAVFLSDTKSIVEETNLYVVSQMAKQSLKYPCKELNSIMLHPAYGDISTETKKIIASVQAKYMPNGLLDIYNIDLNDVYILDSDKIASSKKYKDNIFLIKSSTGDYSLAFNTPVHVLGVDYYELQKVEVANSTQNSGETKIFAIGNNTFKLDKTNHLKGLGQKNEISGATTEEVDELNSLYKEFKPNELVPNTVKYKLAYNTAYMLNNNGDLYAIGENSNNKLGLGNEHLQLDTVKLTFPENIKVKDFFCGIRQTFVVDTNNNVWAAGSNEQGEFGLKNTTMYSGFVKITGLDGSKIKDIIFSDNVYVRFTVAIYDNGDVLAAGSNGTATLGAPSYTNTYEFKNISNNWKTNVNIAFPLKQIKIVQLVNGILDSNDTLWVCGYNTRGQLGNGDKNYQWGFIKYMDNVADFNINIDSVFCKTKTDNIYISPKGVYNELTQKDEYFSEKVLVNNLPVGNKKVIRNYSIYDEAKKQIITKDLAFVLDLKVYYAQSDKKENPTFTVVEDTTTPKNIVDIVNEQQMLILKDNDSKVYLYNQNYITAKGKNIQKELRDINKDQTFEYVDGFGDKIHLIDGEYRLWIGTNDKVLRQNVIKSLVTSTNEYMLLNSGELYSRGKSVGVGYGAGGWGTNDEKIEFVLIQSNVKNIYACCGGAISIDKDNKIYCFGQLWNQFLNLPQYTDNTNNIHIPTLVTGYINTINIKDIYLLHSNGGAGGTATYIKDDKGDVYSFSHGNAQYNGIGSNVSDFTKIILPGKVKKIKCGYNYTLCLLENGEVYAWGTNTNGQFGNGYEISKNYPIPQKLNIDAVTEVAAGDGYAIYVKSGDEIYGCGKNEFGQLGDATTKSSAEFVRCINLEK
ncbi:MAG: hypothetical protein RSB76_01780, partial [Clostridia bacterium]